MKHIAAYLLILAISLHLLADLAVLLSFKMNQDYIAKFLCIEKDVPESNCKGCCQLKKELDEQHESKEATPQSENKQVEIQFFNSYLILQHIQANTAQKLLIFYIGTEGVSYQTKIFHPPRFIS